MIVARHHIPARVRGTAAAIVLAMLPFAAVGQDSAAGRSLYLTHCASCHGEDGRPMMGGAPDFTRSEGLFQADVVLSDAIRSTRVIEHGFEGLLSEQDIQDIIAYLRDFF